MEVEKLGGQHLAEINQMRFAETAQLMLDEADENGIKAVVDVEADHDLSVSSARRTMCMCPKVMHQKPSARNIFFAL